MQNVVRSDEKTSLFGLKVNGPVFWTSALVTILSVTLSLVFRKNMESIFKEAQNLIATNTGWFLILSINIFLFFVIYLAFSRFGKIRIGGTKAKPEFSRSAWFAMLFSAGMGIGLLFWSIAEPVFHLNAPPNADPQTIAAAREAMKITFLHWGLHPWGVYALVGLALAFFTYNRGLPLTIRSVFHPFLGDKIHGKIGDAIDIFAVLATLFGLATSLGFGVQQIGAGLQHVMGIPNTLLTQIILIAIITSVATISVVTGIGKGVKILSEMNMRLALLLLLVTVFLGPTIFILKAFVQNTGIYLSDLFSTALWTETYSNGGWQKNWTTFYWGWWIAWSPFVGMFIARISKGRTVREFVLGVLIVPTILTFLWITAFGSTAIKFVLGGNKALVNAVNSDVSTSLFTFFESFPFTTVLAVLGVILVASFFVTSSDSGSLVVDSLTSGGKIDAPVGQRIFWALAEGTVAAVLLAGGGLKALQTASITTALPFTVILLVMCYSLHIGLKEELLRNEEAVLKKRAEKYSKLMLKLAEKQKKEVENEKK